MVVLVDPVPSLLRGLETTHTMSWRPLVQVGDFDRTFLLLDIASHRLQENYLVLPLHGGVGWRLGYARVFSYFMSDPHALLGSWR